MNPHKVNIACVISIRSRNSALRTKDQNILLQFRIEEQKQIDVHHFEKWCLSDGGETWWWMILGTGNKMRLYYENKFPEKKTVNPVQLFQYVKELCALKLKAVFHLISRRYKIFILYLIWYTKSNFKRFLCEEVTFCRLICQKKMKRKLLRNMMQRA